MLEGGIRERFNDDLENEETPDFGAEEKEDRVETILDSLSEPIITEDNEDLISDIRRTVSSVKEAYENSNKPEAWNELWDRLSEEVLEPLLRPMSDNDYDAAETNWDDIKLELMRLRNN